MAKTFTLEMDCDNAAFEGDPAPEAVRILRAIADKIEAGAADNGRVSDVNGNAIGRWYFRNVRA